MRSGTVKKAMAAAAVAARCHRVRRECECQRQIWEDDKKNPGNPQKVADLRVHVHAGGVHAVDGDPSHRNGEKNGDGEHCAKWRCETESREKKQQKTLRIDPAPKKRKRRYFVVVWPIVDGISRALHTIQIADGWQTKTEQEKANAKVECDGPEYGNGRGFWGGRGHRGFYPYYALRVCRGLRSNSKCLVNAAVTGQLKLRKNH